VQPSRQSITVSPSVSVVQSVVHDEAVSAQSVPVQAASSTAQAVVPSVVHVMLTVTP
jgi:hypothetical protein